MVFRLDSLVGLSAARSQQAVVHRRSGWPRSAAKRKKTGCQSLYASSRRTRRRPIFKTWGRRGGVQYHGRSNGIVLVRHEPALLDFSPFQNSFAQRNAQKWLTAVTEKRTRRIGVSSSICATVRPSSVTQCSSIATLKQKPLLSQDSDAVAHRRCCGAPVKVGGM